MQKKVLSEQSLYYGDVSMPKGFEIDRSILCVDTLKHSFRNLSNPTLDFELPEDSACADFSIPILGKFFLTLSADNN